jgi:hypothetical protein
MDREAVGKQAALASEVENQCVTVNKGVETMRRFFDGATNNTIVCSAAYQPHSEETSYTSVCRPLSFVATKTFNSVKQEGADHGMSVN